MLTLADCILDGYSSQLASLEGNEEVQDRHTKVEEEFVQQRYALLSPFCKLSAPKVIKLLFNFRSKQLMNKKLITISGVDHQNQ